MNSPLTLGDFAQGFVARLVELGETAIRPKAHEDRFGLKRVIDALEAEIRMIKAQGSSIDPDWYRVLVALRNELKPSNSGAFDGFETALRNLQLSFTSCPNPFYEEIAFTVTKPYAKSVIDEYPDRERALIDCVAKAFVEARRSARS
jgi:hypothetical protein